MSLNEAIFQKENSKSTPSKMHPIVHTKKTYNGGTACTVVGNYDKQKICMFYEKSPFFKKCTWLREEIQHCSNSAAQRYKKESI